MAKQIVEHKIGANIVKLAAILGLTIIEVVALLCGMNGQLQIIVVAGVAGLGGYALRETKETAKS